MISMIFDLEKIYLVKKKEVNQDPMMKYVAWVSHFV